LIYRKRKKVDDVKKYIKTVNPDLPKQQTQKGYFKEAINEWQTAGYSSFDVKAWDLYARSKKVIASGFNRFTGLKIKADKEGKTWNKLTNCNIYDVTGEGFKVDINIASDLSGILYLGTSKFSMLKEFEGTFSINKYTFKVTGLSKQKRYYFYIKNTSEGEEGRTGIYSKKTGIGLPIAIDIGSGATDRDPGLAAPRTIVDKNNPANETGTITSIELWVNISMTDCKVATFYVVSGNILSTRDIHTIGEVIAGSKQTFSGLSLKVEKGDYIGFYSSTGKIEQNSSGGLGMWYSAFDRIPCENEGFSYVGNYLTSIYGKGTK